MYKVWVLIYSHGLSWLWACDVDSKLVSNMMHLHIQWKLCNKIYWYTFPKKSWEGYNSCSNLITLTNTCRHLIIPRKHNQVQATVMAIICITFLKELHGFINSSTQPFREIVLLYQRDRQEYLYGSKLIMQKFSQAYAIWFVLPPKNHFLNCNVDEIWLLPVIWVLWFFICHTLSLVTWSLVKAARGRKYCVYRDNKD